jgi:hypothetical protein
MDFSKIAKQFTEAIPAVGEKAAAEATTASKTAFESHLNERGRPHAPVRRGRPTTLGQFGSDIVWESAEGNVTLDMRRLPRYALIQEIGTGESARILNPPGEVTVRSQVGRSISGTLAWSSGPGGDVKSGKRGASGDQLYYASDLNHSGRWRRKMKIRREIVGKHFIRDGGRAGFVKLRAGLIEEAGKFFR